jgi:hypothetical protein
VLADVVGSAHRGHAVHGHRRCEDADAGEHPSSGLGQERMAPGDHVAQGPLPRRGVEPAVGELQPRVEAGTELGGSECAHLARCQLQGERQAVQRAADLRHPQPRDVVLAGAVVPDPVLEQPAGVLLEQRRHHQHAFTVDAQGLPAGRQHRGARAGAHEAVDQRGAAVEQVLAVVEHQQQPVPVGQRGQHGALFVPVPWIADRQHERHLVDDERGIGETGEVDQPGPAREVRGDHRGRLEGQAGLPDPAGAGEGHRAGAAQGLGDAPHLLAPADERGDREPDVSPRRHGGSAVLVAQDRLLERSEFLGRLDPQLVDQPTTVPAEDVERLHLPAGAVEGVRPQAGQVLALRVRAREVGEPGDDLGVPALAECRLRRILGGDQHQLLQPGSLGRDERHVGQVVERLAPAQAQRRVRVPRGQQPLEPGSVHRVGSGPERIAAPDGLDRLGAQDATQLRHVLLQRLGGGRRRGASPDVVAQAAGWDSPPRGEDQAGQHRPLARTAEEQAATVRDRLNRAQEAVLDPPLLPVRSSHRTPTVLEPPLASVMVLPGGPGGNHLEGDGHDADHGDPGDAAR